MYATIQKRAGARSSFDLLPERTLTRIVIGCRTRNTAIAVRNKLTVPELNEPPAKPPMSNGLRINTHAP
jgi:hypothetical protein